MLPHEVVSKYVLPYLRGLIALELISSGLSQFKVAKLMGVSQPLISRYLSEGSEYLMSKLVDVGLYRDEVSAVTKLLAEVLRRGRVQDYIRILSSYINSVLSRGLLCRKHRELMSSLPPNCDLCTRLFRSATDPYIEEVRNAYELLRSHPLAYTLVPEVGMNIVVATPNASSVTDVVGFAGRIVRVGKELRAVGEPVYGGSRHTAMVLLSVKRLWNDVRAVIVIKFLQSCLRKFINVFGKDSIAYVGPHKDPSLVFRDIVLVLKSRDKVPKVIADLGGQGLEPVIYVLGSSALEVVEEVLKCIEALPK